MSRLPVVTALVAGLVLLGRPAIAQPKADKVAVIKGVDARGDEAWKNASQIWEWAEPGYQEVKSAKLLEDWLASAGFRIQAGVANIPTAFTAEFGEGRPVIGILGEYDALPGLAQESLPERKARPGNGYGHGCGHHLFGVASAVAAMSIADQIKAGKLKGTVRFYGCPAEEGGGAKAFMARDGLFKDVDAVLHWHPGTSNSAGDRGTLARIAAKFRFHGKSAHAGGAPEQGRSSLD
ncbi:MAG TPA: amidohydrolase, partial [Caulifigura sp.]|nr:amidohydrolase [Caulifigura sp.]